MDDSQSKHQTSQMNEITIILQPTRGQLDEEKLQHCSPLQNLTQKGLMENNNVPGIVNPNSSDDVNDVISMKALVDESFLHDSCSEITGYHTRSNVT